MLTSFKLEYIGEHIDVYGHMANKAAKEAGYNLGYKSSRPWVALITGRDPIYGYTRTFQQSQKDYSQANSVGSRGVYLYFTLKEGIYEVFQHESWKRSKRYFIRVQDTTFTEISRDDVEAWLNSQMRGQENQGSSAEEEL